MKTKRRLAALLLAAALVTAASTAAAGWQDILTGVTDALKTQTALSQADIAAGLREALAVGSRKAVATVGRLDGYYGDPAVRIPLPEDVQQMESLLRTAGLGDQVDGFVLSMNRAAEKAAPQAAAIFLDAAKKITFSDAATILNGRDDEATRYFKDRTLKPLTQRFTPMVHASMATVGVTKAYQDLAAAARRIPFVAERLRFDLDAYVTGRALDGLFLMLAREERLIRENPAARTTELLKKVFGSAPRQ